MNKQSLSNSICQQSQSDGSMQRQWRQKQRIGPWLSVLSPRCMDKKGSPYLITERMVPELILVLCSQPAGDVSHKPGVARPAVTLATLNRAATNFAACWTEAQWVWTVCLRCYPTASRLRFEPGPFCAWVQHANHSATEPPRCTDMKVQKISTVPEQMKPESRGRYRA